MGKRFKYNNEYDGKSKRKMKKLTTEEIVNRIKKNHPELLFEKTKYVSSNTSIIITCKIHGDFKANPFQFIHFKRGCPKCSVKYIGIDKIQFRLDTIFHGNIIFLDKEYINSKSIHNFKCIKHNLIFKKKVCTILQGHGCKLCSSEKRSKQQLKPLEKFILEYEKVYGKNKYQVLEYSSNRNVKLKCLTCDNIFIKNKGDFLHKKSGCNICSNSYEEEFSILLKNKNILFENHKSFDDLKDAKKLTYDFYLPKYNYLIELQGPQHYFNLYHKPIHDFHRQLHHDWLKRKYAQKNNIKMLIISYKDYNNFENILNSLLEIN